MPAQRSFPFHADGQTRIEPSGCVARIGISPLIICTSSPKRRFQWIICVVLPTLVIWLIGRVKQNETNRKAEIMLKALDNGAKIDTDFFKSQSGSKTIKERLLGRLTGACVTALLGVAVLAVAIYMGCTLDWSKNDDAIIITTMLGGILLAVGVALFIVYFSGKKMLAKEIAAEEKQLTEGK